MRLGGAALCPHVCVGAKKSRMIVEVILTGLGTKPIFHILDESLCISYSFPPGTSLWSKKMPCCRGLEKVNGNGLDLPRGGGQRCHLVLTKSGRDRQNPAWVCVSRENTKM